MSLKNCTPNSSNSKSGADATKTLSGNETKKLGEKSSTRSNTPFSYILDKAAPAPKMSAFAATESLLGREKRDICQTAGVN